MFQVRVRGREGWVGGFMCEDKYTRAEQDYMKHGNTSATLNIRPFGKQYVLMVI
jgi:hypothetical protein